LDSGGLREGTAQMIKVLLAEDDEFSRDMLVRRLERNGYEVTGVANGREALNAVPIHRPDVILMDLDMPVMDGRAAIRVLRSDPRTFRIPIVVLTSHTSPEDVTEAVKAGCWAYEVKPVVLRRLMDRIEEALQHKPKETAAAPNRI